MQFAPESSWNVVRIFGHLLVDIRKFRGLTLAMALWKRVPKMTSSSFSIPRRTSGKRGYTPVGLSKYQVSKILHAQSKTNCDLHLL
jgi:hypothetical protein